MVVRAHYESVHLMVRVVEAVLEWCAVGNNAAVFLVVWRAVEVA